MFSDFFAGKETFEDLHKNKVLTIPQECEFYPYEIVRVSNGEKDTWTYHHSSKLYKHGKTKKIDKLKLKNPQQEIAADFLLEPSIKLVILCGKAGTGKTLLGISSAISQVLDQRIYEKIVIARPTISLGQGLGYLKGGLEDKLYPWMNPIFDNFNLIFNEKKRKYHDELMSQGLLEMIPLQMIRGRTFHNTFMIIDESQNLTPHELKTILTRAGENTKIVLTGDTSQVDTKNSGLSDLIGKFESQEIAAHVFLTKGERSQLAEISASIL